MIPWASHAALQEQARHAALQAGYAAIYVQKHQQVQARQAAL